MSEGQEPHRRRDNMRTLNEWLGQEHKIGYEAGGLKAEARIRELEVEYLRENKALQAIEALQLMLGGGMVEMATKKELVKFASEIYRMSHSAQPGICFESHEAWRKEADIILAAAKKHGIAEYQNPFEPDKTEAVVREMEENLKAKPCGK